MATAAAVGQTTGRVAVVGAGISGLSTAACLQRIGYDVHLFEEKDKDRYLQDKPDHGFGIWSNALKCLAKLGLKEQLESRGRFMKEVGYKTKSGEWLAQPSRHLRQHIIESDDQESPGSLFLLYSDLIKMLRSVAPPIKFSTKFPQKMPSTSSSPEYDFHVIATGNNLKKADIAAYQGYVVYRGLCPASENGGRLKRGHSSQGGEGLNASFQTWSNGKRFATVPMRNHWVWYATIPTPVQQERTAACGITLSPRSWLVTEEQKRMLADEFSEWHDPILSLIENTGHEHITAEFAYSSLDTTVPPSSSSSSPQSIFLGDAAFVLDPILAQGGGVCIEEAFQLAYQISHAKKNSQPISVAFAALEQKRKRRIRTLQYLSNLSQTIGCLKSPIDTLRDASMLAIPRVLSCSSFDALMTASVSTSLLVDDFDFLTGNIQ
mmetsp:Transcript_23284/g.32561  ORF Transcript_23284/g.32561 Transcript_23284/m.32561 type:complete len:435 (-) Transcript_23284:231-1535(-)|eukprot:CAMPEP_0185257858 /NCGR_PEP_ID=MMETSP1359-20130426/6867_1 /TAXON_ID=552665 /ORGANISM="Bigelowiella longifila, Strain CCMP242" /LENGTH=434 /DNA_ID=CAMNT_0027843123 /DNA_START=207 /DNA_END=1511 /DNA_ORIENTATION=-